MATERAHRRHMPGPGPVALFVDWDNFAIGLRQEMPERPPDLGPILRWARRTGTLIVCRAYGEWRDPAERLAIYNAGVDAVYAPVLPLGGSLAARSGAGGAKSLADTAMAVDVAEFLTLVPSVRTLILATSDKDLIPVIRFAQKRGVFAGVVGSDRTAAALRELADEFVTYRQLLEDEAPQPVALSRPVTVPPLRVARLLRRFGDPVAEPVMREPRPTIMPPVIARREPVIEEASGGVPPASESGDPDPDGARRRRRGGRRRRGAETLGLADAETPVVSVPGATDEDELETPDAPPAPVAETTPPSLVASRPSIVPPLIAPRAPRPSAARHASILPPAPPVSEQRPSPQPASALAELPAAAPAPAAPPPLPVASQPLPSSDPAPDSTMPPTTDPPRRPRVQLPGERLRRLEPSGGLAAVQAADRATAVVEEPPPVAPDPVTVPSIEEPLLVQSVTVDASRDEPDPVVARHGDTPEDPPTTDVPTDAGAASTDEPAARARRRRGGRSTRAPSAEGETPATLQVIEGPIASPNDPDSASAPEPATPEGASRGRRRGGRARSTA